MDRLTGIHAVREALEAGRAFDRIVIARGRQDTRVEDIVKLARERNISVRFEDRGQLDRLADSKDHQGVVALAAARAAATLEDILAAANAGPGKGEKGLIVLLDGGEDPHNLGAIIRTALAAGAHGGGGPGRGGGGLGGRGWFCLRRCGSGRESKTSPLLGRRRPTLKDRGWGTRAMPWSDRAYRIHLIIRLKPLKRRQDRRTPKLFVVLD